jgi:uncharacterized membrane protein YhaH (DUF805 family)
MGFTQAVRTCLTKYANFQGRAQRSEYWYFVLAYCLLLLVVAVIALMLGGGRIILPVMGLVFLGIFLPSLAAQVRRLHDTNASGWWILLAFIPYVGGVIMLVWFCLPGTKGENRFGPDPLDPGMAEAFD